MATKVFLVPQASSELKDENSFAVSPDGKTLVAPTAVDEDFDLTVCCLCQGDHEPINRHRNYTAIELTPHAFTVVD